MALDVQFSVHVHVNQYYCAALSLRAFRPFALNSLFQTIVKGSLGAVGRKPQGASRHVTNVRLSNFPSFLLLRCFDKVLDFFKDCITKEVGSAVYRKVFCGARDIAPGRGHPDEQERSAQK